MHEGSGERGLAGALLREVYTTICLRLYQEAGVLISQARYLLECREVALSFLAATEPRRAA